MEVSRVAVCIYRNFFSYLQGKKFSIEISQVALCIYNLFLHLLRKFFFIKMPRVISQADVPGRCISRYCFSISWSTRICSSCFTWISQGAENWVGSNKRVIWYPWTTFKMKGSFVSFFHFSKKKPKTASSWQVFQVP